VVCFEKFGQHADELPKTRASGDKTTLGAAQVQISAVFAKNPQKHPQKRVFAHFQKIASGKTRTHPGAKNASVGFDDVSPHNF
jgi:hypothetical protein